MLDIYSWPPYRAARRALDLEALFELESELLIFSWRLALCDERDEVEQFIGAIGTPVWIELGEFEVLAQLSLDQAGGPDVLRLLQLRRMERSS